jgi:arylsulfatase A-like enzyme
VDYMSIYPTLCDLAGIPKPAHVEGKSIKSLLVDPKSAWDTPALTTHMFSNHAVRTEGWRYIRYANGDEELYDETTDPLEHKNLAGDSTFAGKKAELAKWLPKENKEPITAKGEGKDKDKDKKAAKKKKKEDAE